VHFVVVAKAGKDATEKNKTEDKSKEKEKWKA
jgi:hypothetical protein